MNCHECQALLHQKLDGAAVPAGPPLDAHLAACPVCREQFAAAQRFLEALKLMPKPQPGPDLAQQVVSRVLRDRQLRYRRTRQRVYLTAILAASVLLLVMMSLYYFLPRTAPTPHKQGPIAKGQDAVKKEEPPKQPTPGPVEVKKGEVERPTFAALTGKLADKTLDQARVLWSAANPADVVPMGELPRVADLDPLEPEAAQSIKQASHEVTEGLSTVTRSARRAFDYFSREMPALNVPPNP